MAIITLASLGHSAGTSTTALALTARWHRPAILIEADTNTTSSVLAGHFRGQRDHSTGLTQILTASRHGSLTAETIWQHSLELHDQHRVVPGFARIAAAHTDAAFWAQLASACEYFAHSGVDILIDLGRVIPHDLRISIMQQADLNTIVTGTTLPDIASLVARYDETNSLLSTIKNQLATVGHDEWLGLITVNRAEETYSAREISGITGTPTLGNLPWNPKAAAHYSLGTGPKKRQLLGYHRAIDQTIHNITDTLQKRQQLVGLPTATEAAQ